MATMTGGSALEQRLNEIAAKLQVKSNLAVGFLAGAKYPDGTSVALVAFWQNFGTKRMPARPFFTYAIQKHSGEWPDQIAKLLKANDLDVSRTLNQMGKIIQEQVQEEIINLTAPALSPITVMLRGMKANDPSLKITGKTVGEAAARVAAGKTNYGASAKPLIDSALMLNSVDFEVT